MIQIHINGQEKTVADNTTLAQLLTQLQSDQTQQATPMLATAVNEQFIAREQRDHYVLKAGDQVMTFSPITGG